MSKEKSILYANIDCNIICIEDGFASRSNPEWKIKERLTHIKTKLSGLEPTIVCLQELRRFTSSEGELVDSITPLKKFFEESGYNFISKPYNPGEKPFHHGMAYKKDSFSIEGEPKIRYFTKTPFKPTDRTIGDELIKVNNFGEKFEKSVLTVTLRDLKTNELISVSNVHLSSSAECRLEASKVLKGDFLDKELENGANKVIIGGSFNAFPQSQGGEQIKILENDSRLIHQTTKLFLPDDQPLEPPFTHSPYPHDIYNRDQKIQEKKKAMIDLPNETAEDLTKKRETIKGIYEEHTNAKGDQLDCIFTYGMEPKNGMEPKKVTAIPTALYPGEPDYNSSESIKNYVLSHYPDGPAFATDNFWLLMPLGDSIKLLDDSE